MEIGKADFSAYEYQSPIELIVNQVRTEQEDCVVRVVQEMGVNVDKDELLRALRYDRDQYERGYKAGYAHREMKIVRCKDCKHYDPKDDYCNVWGDMFAHWEEYDPVDPDGFCNRGEWND